MLVIILVPAAALFGTVIKISANTRDRVEAANLAAQQIDVGRFTPFGTLAAQATGGTVQTGTAKEGGITYTMAQSATWVNESTNACGGTGNGAAGTQPILAMTETVTWPGMGSTLPIVAQTDIAPPAGYYSSSLGDLAVRVIDSNQAPVVGASVTVTGASPALTVAAGPLATGATGCAFAAFLNPGSYNLSVQLAGYVSMLEQPTLTMTAVAIGSGATVGETVNYAPAAVVPITLTATAATLPGPVTLPTTGFPVTVSDTAYLPGPVTYSAPLAGALQLWPYPNGYDIYAGGCPDNDPAAHSLYAPFAVSQGVTSPDQLQLYGVSITGKDGALAVTNLQVWTASDTTCSTANSSFGPYPVAAGNNALIGVPLGTFKLTVKGTANGQPVSGPLTLPLETGAAMPAQTVTLS